MYTFLMNIWNTHLQSYQQKVYKNTPATVKRQIQQPEISTAPAVISTDVALVDNAILHHSLTTEVAVEYREIGSTNPINPTVHNCTENEVHFGMPALGKDSGDNSDKIKESDIIRTTSRQPWAFTDLESCLL
jgi:hypothetical protein